MLQRIKQLNPPPISKEKDGQEILRLWVNANGLTQLVIEPYWKDPVFWGIVLVDLTRHLAKAYVAREENLSESDVLKRIREIFDAEWANQTDTPKQL